MRINDSFLIIFSFILFALMALGESFNLSESFIIAFQVYTLFRFINNFGHTICYFDFLCFYSVMDTLTAALIGYRVFNRSNEYAQTWGAFMRVPEEDYYAFMIPANVALFVGVNIFNSQIRRFRIKELVRNLDKVVYDKGKIGMVLILIGFFSSVIKSFVPQSLEFIFYLFSMLKFVGPLYLYFSNFRRKALILSLSIGAYFLQAIMEGLFGDFAMYTALLLIIVLMKWDIGFGIKFFAVIMAFLFVTVLQGIKPVYRKITWQGRSAEGMSIKRDSKVDVFATLFLDRLVNPEKIANEEILFGVYRRMNQGYLISRVMNYVPKVEPYANGETIFRSLMGILVPRILWPDKPEAGGRYNLSRFMGIKKRMNFSMNIGPYGEAYGNFGPVWGISFLLVYGIFLGYLLKSTLKYSLKRPTVLLWLPLLFYYTLTVETDILTTVNSFIKGLLFMVFLYWISKKYFLTEL